MDGRRGCRLTHAKGIIGCSSCHQVAYRVPCDRAETMSRLVHLLQAHAAIGIKLVSASGTRACRARVLIWLVPQSSEIGREPLFRKCLPWSKQRRHLVSLSSHAKGRTSFNIPMSLPVRSCGIEEVISQELFPIHQSTISLFSFMGSVSKLYRTGIRVPSLLGPDA